MKLILALLFAAIAVAGEAKVEIGELNGATFRIDIPANWNGGLVMHCHGYAMVPTKFSTEAKLNARVAPFYEAGYAVAQSGYSAVGWAIQEAMDDTQALKRYFISKYGKPKETFITGQSMGGFTTMALIEKFPSDYDAALPFCGPLAPANTYKLRTAFDTRVLFDYYFPGVLPSPVKVPEDFRSNPELIAKVTALLDSKPQEADTLRRYIHVRKNSELASNLVFWTYQLMDLQKRGRGNPFDNRNTIYTDVPDIETVNAKITRYQADPRSAEYLRTFYVPTGKLTRPMLAVHTIYDPLVPTWIPSTYGSLAQDAGNPDLFVLQYVKHDGHCNYQPEEVAKAFSELRRWKDAGERPRSGLLE